VTEIGFALGLPYRFLHGGRPEKRGYENLPGSHGDKIPRRFQPQRGQSLITKENKDGWRVGAANRLETEGRLAGGGRLHDDDCRRATRGSGSRGCVRPAGRDRRAPAGGFETLRSSAARLRAGPPPDWPSPYESHDFSRSQGLKTRARPRPDGRRNTRSARIPTSGPRDEVDAPAAMRGNMLMPQKDHEAGRGRQTVAN